MTNREESLRLQALGKRIRAARFRKAGKIDEADRLDIAAAKLEALADDAR